MKFDEAYELLQANGPTTIPFQTQNGSVVDVWASEVLRGPRKGERVLRIQWSTSTSMIGKHEWDHDAKGVIRHLKITLDALLLEYIQKTSDAFSLILPEANIQLIESWAEITKAISMDSSKMFELSWQKFEDLMAEILDSFGWDIEPLARTKDGGVDIVATRLVGPDITFRMMVQCKKYGAENKVGVDTVKNVWATKWDSGFHQAMVATTSTFTSGASEAATKWGFEMRDHDRILGYCTDYYEKSRGAASQIAE